MARGGRANFDIDFSEFERSLDVVMSRVERGTKRATRAACEEILEASLDQVPRDTNALAESAYYEIKGKYRNFVGVIGYGGNGDPVNPKTGRPASEYMVAVHEDLEAKHADGTKAKFLEDPVKQYQEKFAVNSATIIKEDLGT